MALGCPAWRPQRLVAVVGAAAALTGPLFVAVSINLGHILKGTSMLSARAAETLASLVFVMISAALALVPQNVRQNHGSPLFWSVTRMITSAAATVPGTLAGISLAAHWGGGFYWLAPTALGGLAGAVYSAWIPLVEIIR